MHNNDLLFNNVINETNERKLFKNVLPMAPGHLIVLVAIFLSIHSGNNLS